MIMIVKDITFDEILPIWRDYLWIGRKTEIRPTNGLKLSGGFDKSIEGNDPTFFGVFIDGQFVGVNSGHATSDNEYRSRGIYIFPEYRRQRVSQHLFRAVELQAMKEKKNTLWSMPRMSSLKAYEKFGFSIVSREFNTNVEFGPNCFVVKLLEVDNG